MDTDGMALWSALPLASVVTLHEHVSSLGLGFPFWKNKRLEWVMSVFLFLALTLLPFSSFISQLVVLPSVSLRGRPQPMYSLDSPFIAQV